MGRYRVTPAKPVRVFEVMIPKRIEYFAKLQDVLETLFEPEEIRRVPNIEEELAELDGNTTVEELTAWAKLLFTGYSIFEIDGRFVHPVTRERFDERMLVIRIVFHDRRQEAGMGPDLSAMSEQAVAVLIANRLAEELGTEKELWVLEYRDASLRIWERVADGPES